jgi:hypothetical protein
MRVLGAINSSITDELIYFRIKLTSNEIVFQVNYTNMGFIPNPKFRPIIEPNLRMAPVPPARAAHSAARQVQEIDKTN